MEDSRRKAAYSENSSLGVFLRTLSYHQVGSKLWADAISRAGLPLDWSLLDIGCGDGLFTVELLGRLAAVGKWPASIVGVDPGRRTSWHTGGHWLISVSRVVSA